MEQQTQVQEPQEVNETTGQETSGSEVESSEVSDSKAESGHEKDFTQAETKQIESIMKKFNLPEGVSYLLDKQGELKFIVPISGKRYMVAPQDLFKGFGLQQAGYQKLNEGKQLVGEVTQLFHAIKENPQVLFNLAERLGHDPAELAEKILQAKLDEVQMTPEQRQAKSEKAELERIKAENEEYRQKEKTREFEGLVAQERKRFDEELTAAMIKHGFKKFDTKTKSHVLSEAVKNMKFARENKRELSADDAVYLAKQSWQQFTHGVFDDIDDNHIIDLIPERIIKAIRKADLSRLKGESEGIPTSSSSAGFEAAQQIKNLTEVGEKKPKKKQISVGDYFRQL